MYIQNAFGFFIHFPSWQGEPLRFSPLHPLSQKSRLVSINLFRYLFMNGTNIQSSERRTEVLPPLRVKKSERRQIKAKAAQAGLTLSEFQRRALLDAVVITPPPVANIKLIKELMKQGTNLNQYVRKLNTIGKDTPRGIEETRLKIERLLDDLIQ
jgi:Mobilization protein NikA